MNRHRILAGLVGCLATWCLLASPRSTGLAADAPPTDPNALNLELTALRTLNSLELTKGQLKALAKMAAETAAKPGQRDPAKASDKYVKTMKDLHAAYAKNEEDRIVDLEQALAELTDKDAPEFDEAVDVTPAARKQAPAALRQLGANQVAAYITSHTEDFSDPYDKLREGLVDNRDLKGQEWQDKRDELADEIADLAAGIDEDRAGKLRDKIKALLDRAHKLKEADFKKQRLALRREGREIIGDLGPTDVLKNSLELTLAKLLSNPQLAAALEARIKNIP